MMVGVIGLGIMGGAMAGNLARCGFKVVGYDPAASAIARAKAVGVDTASSAERVVMFDAARPLYAAALAAGQGELDKVSTARVIERMAGITRSPKTSS